MKKDVSLTLGASLFCFCLSGVGILTLVGLYRLFMNLPLW
ncbi:hypothetical protein SRABI13_03519 [Erwinia aphidicola]|jgi:hypothetical protein|nr:hypothetical protein SRABI13_03519 [Erwinia aphidicola]